ncbi:hypothetical protein FOA43_000071 [Brettanomyces nanus]|uniref:NAD-dependent epimerase/dehydratase domain-containing protein n=1 Tax=Eeniella nana TaxID=13502 RepID=A0A875RMV8_EENNA|nr:uncharacterized protein FOA43_000071 [Brettanomyces nanus]QPG72770.1 hypothetical protein FOA43_000071 [Brettanomyces nanus]
MTKSIFVTGATGLVGKNTVDELLRQGYHVTGLARSDASEKALKDNGCEVIRGDLKDIEALKKGAAESDGVIHLGFVHNFADFETCALIDRAAIDAMLSALKGTDRPFISIGGTLGVSEGDGKPNDEDSPYVDLPGFGLRFETERRVLAYASKGVRTISLRLPPTVHGKGDVNGFIPILIAAAEKAGYSFYIPESKNVWSAVNVEDCASLLVLALKKGKAGKAYHAVGEPGVPLKVIGEAIGRKHNLPTKSISYEEAKKLLGFFTDMTLLGETSLSEKTQKELGWKPTHATLVEDIAEFY